MARLYIDIETLPGQPGWVRDDVAAGVKPPATLKKAESIAAWERDERPAAVQEAWERTALDAAYGQVCCIGWAVEDGPVQTRVVADTSLEAERELLADVFGEWQRMHSTSGTRPVVVGHFVTGFDLPFLWRRGVVHGVRPPMWLPRNPKPWSEAVIDTMSLWAGDRDRISLDKLCKALGVPGKGDGPTGADVWPMAQAGKWDEIAAYCAADVERARVACKRMMFE